MIEIKISTISEGEFNRGVFAKENIAKGTLFHEAPVLSYPTQNMFTLRKHYLLIMHLNMV